ncbi:MAG: rhodanese-like domain-containing protein [Clostridia bacterium]
MFENIKKIIFGESNNSRGGFNFNSMPKTRGNSRCLNYNLVPFEQAKAMIETKQVSLIDVRTKSEFNIMHIKGAENIPVVDIEKMIFSKDQEAKLMVYCSSGTRSKTAIQVLNNLGYNNIYIWEYAALATFPYKNMLVYNEQ